MNIQDIWQRILRRLGLGQRRFDVFADVDESGLLIEDNRQVDEAASGTQVLVKKSVDKAQSLERLQEGFSRLVGQLEGINENLAQQTRQQQELMDKMAQLPRVVENFPAAIANQQRMIEHLTERLDASATASQQFMDAVKKIPDEAMRQTELLYGINRQLTSAADAEMMMSENFAKFNTTLDRLNASTVSQTEGVIQMSQTFEASDRYLKHILSQQHNRFMWVFFTAVGVCVFAILALITVIVFIKK
jgi:chromosome segregation ATPase